MKKMKLNLKKIVFFVVLFASFNGYSQKCIVENDPISNEKTCKFSNRHNTLRYEYKFGEFVDFYTTFIYAGEQNVIIPKGSEVFIKLKDESVIQLSSLNDATPQTSIVSSQYGATIYSSYTLAFELTHEEIKTLANSKVVFLRYPSLDGGTVDYDVKGLGKIYAKKITKGAQCIMDNLE